MVVEGLSDPNKAMTKEAYERRFLEEYGRELGESVGEIAIDEVRLTPRQMQRKMSGIHRLIAEALSFEEDWMEFAACKDLGPDKFYGVPNNSGDGTRIMNTEVINNAKKICAGCDVIHRCDEFIRATPKSSRFGVWAGQHYSGK